MNSLDYDIIMAQINDALEAKTSDKVDTKKITEIINSTECPYLLSLVKEKFDYSNHLNRKH